MLFRASILWVALLTAFAGQVSRVWAFTAGTPAPEIAGGPWLNSDPLTIADLKGRVVVVEFWTYG